MDHHFYITTPIYYVNGLPHIGHAYTTIVADTLRRYQRLFGADTFFLTGTDEHGQKIAESATIAALTPQLFADKMSQNFKDLWPKLHIQYDRFIRTTEAQHSKGVQAVLQMLFDKGEIYRKSYEGLYCVGCERFLDETELVQGKCADHQVVPQHHKEENYFFRMSKYQDWLIDSLQQNPAWIYPIHYRNEMLQFLKAPLQDLCISRPKSRLTWGIEIPFDHDFVTYVWFDALLNYTNALGGANSPQFSKYWPVTHHLIGKDILKTHAIYWPCMLKAAGLPLFEKLVVHGHWVSSGSKMSKSLGNVVDPLAMIDLVGVDVLRYFLLRDMSFGEDANFTEELLLTRYHGDLGNNLGNLISRSVSLSKQHFDHAIPHKGTLTELEQTLYKEMKLGIESVKELLNKFQLHRILEQIMTLSSVVNKYIDTTAPWKLAKQENEKARLGTVLYTAIDCLRMIVVLLQPVMPEKMKQAIGFLGLNASEFNQLSLRPFELAAGTPLPDIEPLFPRIQITPPKEPDKIKSETNKTVAVTEDKTKTTSTSPSIITIDQFGQIVLTVGQIISCEKVVKSDKLLHSQVDLGEGRHRSIVSGIALAYQPEQVVGKKVIVVSNLQPAKLRGILSEGMILCSGDGSNLRLVEPSADAHPGEIIK